MVLDTATLRVAFGLVALTMFVLFYLVTHRTTRSAYCGWWCASLALSSSSAPPRICRTEASTRCGRTHSAMCSSSWGPGACGRAPGRYVPRAPTGGPPVDDRRLRPARGVLPGSVRSIRGSGAGLPPVHHLLRRAGDHSDLDRAPGHGLVQHVDAQQRATDSGSARPRRARWSHRPPQSHRVLPTGRRGTAAHAPSREPGPADPGRSRPLQDHQ